jgi:hypothetical protein
MPAAAVVVVTALVVAVTVTSVASVLVAASAVVAVICSEGLAVVHLTCGLLTTSEAAGTVVVL